MFRIGTTKASSAVLLAIMPGVGAPAHALGQDGVYVGWLAQFGSAASDMPGGIALTSAPQPTAIVVGSTQGVLGSASAGGWDVFLTRNDVGVAAGMLVWVRQFGSARDDFGLAVDGDQAGGAFIAGYRRPWNERTPRRAGCVYRPLRCRGQSSVDPAIRHD
jgi:hypothetical protein